MENSKLVSVIVPVYNVEKQLDRCINSLVAQTYKNIEIILVVDGSPDICGAICDMYGAKDSRIKIIQKTNGGLSSARNAGLQTFSGDYLLFVDSDDTLDFNTVESCLDLNDNGNCDVIVFGYHHYLDKKNKNVFLSDTKRDPVYIDSRKELNKNLLSMIDKGDFDFCTDKFYRASLIRDNGILFDGYFDGITEDSVFILDVIPFLNTIKVVPRCFYNYYRREDESYTLNFKNTRFDKFYDRMILEKAVFEKLNLNYGKKYFPKKYSTYFLWTYESLFSNTCKFSLLKKSKFVYTAFRKEEIYTGFNEDWKKYVDENSIDGVYSNGSIAALKLVSKKRYILLLLLFL